MSTPNNREPETTDQNLPEELSLEEDTNTVISASTRQTKDFTTILYEGFKNAFGSMNPYQMLALNWPATVLDEQALDWNPEDTGNVIPPDVRARISQLFDAYIPPSPITQTDGSRVSSRYKATINQLGPIPNPHLLELQRIIREKLQKKVVVYEDGVEIEITVVQWFDRLYSAYISARRSWSIIQTKEQRRLKALYPDQPKERNNAYLEWYSTNAQTELNNINEAFNRLLANFPLHEWEAAISILDTSSDQFLYESKSLVQNLNIQIPPEHGGGSYAPTQGVPLTWSTDLKTTFGELDLLSTPAAKNQMLSNAIRSLEAEIQTWSAIMPNVTDEEVRTRLAEFQTSLQNFSHERTKLAQSWGESVYVVVEAVAAYVTSFSTPAEKFVSAMTNTAQGDQDLTQNLANAINNAYGLGKGEATYNRVTQFVDKIVNQQNGIWAQQHNTIDAGATLAGAAKTWLDSYGRKTEFQWIYKYIEQLNIRLTSLRRVHSELIQSSMIMWKKMWDPDKEHTVDGNLVRGAYVPLTETEIQHTTTGITPRANYDKLGTPDPNTTKKPDTWTKVLMSLSKSDMKSSERMKTSFTRREWGVNFFFGSYGSVQETQTSTFANEFMSDKSEIQIGLLAKKVNIRRNWMEPTILRKSGDYFRSANQRFMLNRAVTAEEILADENIQTEIQSCLLPCYPVSLLIAKDVSIKMNFDFSKTERIKQYASNISSSGGGFFLFNSSSVSSSSDSFEAISVNVEAGELEVKFKSPQIIGYYLEISPPDESTDLTQAQAEEIASSISFINTLRNFHNEVKQLSTQTDEPENIGDNNKQKNISWYEKVEP